VTEYENEPIPGLPGLLPPGESIIWQGSPDWKVLARTAFHTRLVAGYFALLAAWAFVSGLAAGTSSPMAFFGFGATVLAGAASVGLLYLIAWASARTTIYTLTEKRIVLRIGIALPKCINLPLSAIGAADLAERGAGLGDISLTPTATQRLGYLALWPHARPWHLATPQPMLRALPEASRVAAMIARTCLPVNPAARPAVKSAAAPHFPEAAAA
jgi:hypothetical protein